MYLAVLLLIPFHTSMIYNQWSWHIKYHTVSMGLTIFNGFLGIWHMPLFFIISGAATGIALTYKGSGGYLTERMKRLLIPLIFGMLVIVPPQIYCERLFRGQFIGSYLQFYPSVFTTGSYPDCNLSWHHIWFLAYLFTFSLLLLPLFNWLRRPDTKALLEKFNAFVGRPYRIFWLAVPLFIINLLLRVAYPGEQNLINDWANFLFYITVFGYGYLLTAGEGMRRAMVQTRWQALAIGGCISLAVLILEQTGNFPPWSYNAPQMLILGFRGLETWCYLIAILGFGSLYLNKGHRLLPYAARAAFPFYIIHQTVIVILGYYAIQTDWPIAIQFSLICITSLTATLLLYDLVVKRIPPIGFLFGLKPEPYRRREGTTTAG
jgi:fucose 4-O-acetylase-like acetyltransferase